MKILINSSYVDKSVHSEKEKAITPKIRTSSNPIIIPKDSMLYVRYIKNFDYYLLATWIFTVIQYKPDFTSKSFSVFSNYSILVNNKIESILLESTEIDWFYEYYMGPK